MNDVEKLRQQVFQLRSQQVVDSTDSNSTTMQDTVQAQVVEGRMVDQPGELILELPTSCCCRRDCWVIEEWSCLRSWRYALSSRLDGRFQWNIPDWREYVPWMMNGWMWVAVGSAERRGGFLLLKTLSAAWYILRFYGYSLRLRGDDLRIYCGYSPRSQRPFHGIAFNM